MTRHDLTSELSASSRRRSVLIVEDEPLILMDAMDLVEDAGFTAIGVSNADQALRVLAEHDDIDILFTDVDMPGSMNGLALARSVHGSRPYVSVVVASGRARPIASDLPAGGVFLQKPYLPTAVIAAIQTGR